MRRRRLLSLGKVERDNLSISTKNTLGAISTLFKISDSAANEIELLLKGKTPSKSDGDEIADEGGAEQLEGINPDNS
jgi:restriction system protein